MRGFSSEAINVQLNGLDLQGTGYERTIDLSGFLADNISQVTVHKSLLPSHESTGSGGLVEIEPNRPRLRRLRLNVSVEGESNFDRDFGEEYQINGTIAKELTPSFGIAATLQYRNTDRLNYDVSILDTVPPVLPEGYTSIFFVPASSNSLRSRSRPATGDQHQLSAPRTRRGSLRRLAQPRLGYSQPHPPAARPPTQCP